MKVKIMDENTIKLIDEHQEAFRASCVEIFGCNPVFVDIAKALTDLMYIQDSKMAED